jgi:nucleoside-diphosphate-sugar epimerase
MHVNVGGTRNVLEAARRAGVRRVVHLSSWRVHGRRLPDRVEESLPLVDRGNPYDVSKACAEREAFAFASRHGLELVALRPTIVYGPGCGPWVDALVERLKYERLRLIGGGRGLANVVFVDDVVAAILCALRSRAGAGEAFLVSAARPCTWREYLEPLCAALRKPLPSSIPDWAAPGVAGLAHWHFRFTRRPPAIVRGDPGLFSERAAVCIDRARQRLGFSPRFDLADGMAVVVRDLQARGLVGAQAVGSGARRHEPAPFQPSMVSAGDAAVR